MISRQIAFVFLLATTVIASPVTRHNRLEHRQTQCGPNEISSGQECIPCKDGTQAVGNQCQRYFNCANNQDCISRTGNDQAYCYLAPGVQACFAPSTNSDGLPAGSGCGGNPAGDDNGCATGLVCYEQKCQSPSQNNPASCGADATSCPDLSSGSSGSGYASCIRGSCGITCTSGVPDGDSCSTDCQGGTFLSGGTCARRECSTNADCVASTGLDTATCAFNRCFSPSTNENGIAKGSGCGTSPNLGDDYSCDEGLVCLGNICQSDVSSNVNNCGSPGNVCRPPASNGQATCLSGECGVSCNTDSMPNDDGDCVLSGSAGVKQRRHRKRSIDASLCPLGETACPIAGRSLLSATNLVLSQTSSYECLDISSDVSSCGGCSSQDQEKDCTTLPHSLGVGCASGECVILSCTAGYSVSLDGSACNLTTGPVRSPQMKLNTLHKQSI